MRFALVPLAPFRLDLTVWALRRHPRNRIDAWDGWRYVRVLTFGSTVLRLEVVQHGGIDAPTLAVNVEGRAVCTAAAREWVTATLRRTLGMDVDLGDFYRFTATKPALAALAARYRGMKPPRFPSLFEALANAIACQQVSLASGIVLLGRLARELALTSDIMLGTPPFPAPSVVLAAGADALHATGWSRQKASYLLAAAEALENGTLDEGELNRAGDELAQRLLSRLRGIKRWSAQYIALRGLSRLAVFPVDDIAAHKHLALWLALPAKLDAESTQDLVSDWKPYAGMVYFHILLKRLEAAGELEPQGRGGDQGAKMTSMPITIRKSDIP